LAIKKKRETRDEIERYHDTIDDWLEQFEQTLLGRPSWNRMDRTIEPLHELRVTPTEVIVTADLPMTQEKAVHVTPLDDRTLEIKAKMTRKVSFKKFGVIHHEGEYQTFHSHTHIPVPVQMGQMKVKYKKGMLEVHLPRLHERLSLKKGK
jgi:HSP20 family molecular chaperone IbpA